MKKKNFPAIIPIKGRVRVCLEFIRSQDTKGKRIVDVGSSTGWLEKEIARDGAREVVGIEPDREALQFAKTQVPGARFLIGDAAKIPLSDSFADIVALFDVVEHIPRGGEVGVLREANRVLKKEGRFLLSTPNSHWLTNLLDPAWYIGHRHYSLKKIQRLIEEGGFKIIKSEIRGGIWFSIYLLWLYIIKRFTKNPLPRSRFLEDRDDRQFSSPGIHTIFIVAERF